MYKELNNKNDEIQNNDENMRLCDIKNNIEFLKKLNGFETDITFSNSNENILLFIDFLNILENNEESIKFAMGKKNEEIRAFSEFVGETQNSQIQIRDIQDFMNVCNFF